MEVTDISDRVCHLRLQAYTHTHTHTHTHAHTHTRTHTHTHIHIHIHIHTHTHCPHLASGYTDYTILAHISQGCKIISLNNLFLKDIL